VCQISEACQRRPNRKQLLATCGVQVERWWSRPFRNFDNIGNAMLSLFTVGCVVCTRYLANMLNFES
jgi:hypothetical protein